MSSNALAELYGVCRDTVINHVHRAAATPGRIVILTDADVAQMAQPTLIVTEQGWTRSAWRCTSVRTGTATPWSAHRAHSVRTRATS